MAASAGGAAAPELLPDWMFREMTLFVREQDDRSARAVHALRHGRLRDAVTILNVDELRRDSVPLPPWLAGVPTLFVRDREEIYMGRDAVEFLAESSEAVHSTAGLSGTFRSRNERIGARPLRSGRRGGSAMIRASVLDDRTMNDPEVRAHAGRHDGPAVDMDAGPLGSTASAAAASAAALLRSADPHVAGMARRREELNERMRRNRERQMADVASAAAAFSSSAAAGPVMFLQEEA